MPKIQVKRGLPGSGKSTESYATVKTTGNSGRINRDDLRAMLFESVWTGRREQVVIDCEKAIAKVLFEHGQNAVIDDCNLSQSHVDMWKNTAKQIGFSEVTIDPIKADIASCVEADLHREKYVGKAIIHRLALSGGLINWNDKPIAIVDIDGTLADGTHREHFLSGEKKDWKSYFGKCHEDSPIDIVVRWVRELAKEHTVCLVSGRPDSTQSATITWLKLHQVPYDFIFMRQSSDKRPDTMVKQDILNKMPKEKVSLVIDDRPSVIRMWRDNGLKVIPVRGAIDEF